MVKIIEENNNSMLHVNVKDGGIVKKTIKSYNDFLFNINASKNGNIVLLNSSINKLSGKKFKIIYHGEDNDGRVSMLLFLSILPYWAYDEIELCPVFFSRIPSFNINDDIDENTAIVFLDYTPDKEFLTDVYSKTKKITWIDHHQANIINKYNDDDLKYFNDVIKILDISNEHSACSLSWMLIDYLSLGNNINWKFDSFKSISNNIKSLENKTKSNIPIGIQYIENGDIYHFDGTKNDIFYLAWLDASKSIDELCPNLTSNEYYCIPDAYSKLKDIILCSPSTDYYIRVGEFIESARINNLSDLIKNHQTWEFDDEVQQKHYTAYIANVSGVHLGTKDWESILDLEKNKDALPDFFIAYKVMINGNKEYYKLEIRTPVNNPSDCSYLANMLHNHMNDVSKGNGGGHKAASGCFIDYNPFLLKKIK